MSTQPSGLAGSGRAVEIAVDRGTKPSSAGSALAPGMVQTGRTTLSNEVGRPRRFLLRGRSMTRLTASSCAAAACFARHETSSMRRRCHIEDTGVTSAGRAVRMSSMVELVVTGRKQLHAISDSTARVCVSLIAACQRFARTVTRGRLTLASFVFHPMGLQIVPVSRIVVAD
jgi:hypothetical protein